MKNRPPNQGQRHATRTASRREAGRKQGKQQNCTHFQRAGAALRQSETEDAQTAYPGKTQKPGCPEQYLLQLDFFHPAYLNVLR